VPLCFTMRHGSANERDATEISECSDCQSFLHCVWSLLAFPPAEHGTKVCNLALGYRYFRSAFSSRPQRFPEARQHRHGLVETVLALAVNQFAAFLDENA